jgi:hypothetical protein
LPFLAVAAAFSAQAWLPAVALGSVAVWITFPHHFATWMRTFGVAEDWRRFKDQLIVGTTVILTITFVGLRWAPLTFAALVSLWDHQHSLMQQHGFARIYDFKAKSGTPTTGRWDLALNWILYGNLFFTAPMFTTFWVREAYRFGLNPTRQNVESVHALSWTAAGVFLAFYTVHVVRSVRSGYCVNPIKYIFIAASYFLWYFCGWQTASILVLGVAQRLMHGLQYIVMVYWYLRRKSEQHVKMNRVLYHSIRPGHVLAFAGMCAGYAVLYQLFAGRPLGYLGFGVVNLMTTYPAVRDLGLPALSEETGLELLTLVAVSSVDMIHFYFDSFIWKVRDIRVQSGL